METKNEVRGDVTLSHAVRGFIGHFEKRIEEQSAEIQRLKGLLREAADDLDYAGHTRTASQYREAGEVTK
jgi:hypothetical protein